MSASVCWAGVGLTKTEKNIFLFIHEEQEGGTCSCSKLFLLNELHYFCLLFCFITIVGKVIFINFCLHAFAIVVIDIIFLIKH